MEMHYYDFEGDLELFGEYDNFTNRLAQTGNDDVVVNVLKKAVSKGVCEISTNFLLVFIFINI